MCGENSAHYWETPYAQPFFDNTTKRDITATVGQPALLHCRVRNLGDRAVSCIWIFFFCNFLSFFLSCNFYSPVMWSVFRGKFIFGGFQISFNKIPLYAISFTERLQKIQKNWPNVKFWHEMYPKPKALFSFGFKFQWTFENLFLIPFREYVSVLSMLNAYECITWFITTNREQNNECFYSYEMWTCAKRNQHRVIL